jgi:hypothetical protein
MDHLPSLILVGCLQMLPKWVGYQNASLENKTAAQLSYHPPKYLCRGKDLKLWVYWPKEIILDITILLHITYLFLSVISCLTCNLLFKSFKITNIKISSTSMVCAHYMSYQDWSSFGISKISDDTAGLLSKVQFLEYALICTPMSYGDGSSSYCVMYRNYWLP